MKPRYLVPILVVVVVLLVFVLRHSKPESTIGSDESKAPADTSQSVTPDTVNNLPIQTSSTVVLSSQSRNAATAPSAETLHTNSQALAEVLQQRIKEGTGSVAFFGRVIDQDSNGLPGVRIQAKVRDWFIPSLSTPGIQGKMTAVEKESGPDGRFEIQGITGDGIDIEAITKDGYELEPIQRTYGARGGDSAEPLIFKMWSTNVHEHLISGQKSFHIVPDGRAYVIDLSKGTIAESGEGDIKVWVKRPEQITRGQKYDWSCGIDIPNGGLQETGPGTAMYQAPTEGYTPSFMFEQKVGSGWGDFTGTKRFYVSLNGGKYGRISIELYAFYSKQIPGMVRIEYALNPSGSRVLR